MKTLIAISDTHGRVEAVSEIKRLVDENDYVVHLGDGFADFKELYFKYPKKAFAVRGNCDFFLSLTDEEILEIEDSKVLCCHGHRYGVKSGEEQLFSRAKELGCNVVLYGHTHRAKIIEKDGITLVNPGMMKFPLNAGGTYAYLVFNRGKVTAVLVGTPMI